jgi:DNA-binding Lrp family transcriptional regulator
VVAITAHYILHTFSGGPTGWYGKAQALTDEQIDRLRPRLPPPPPRSEYVEMRDGDASLFAALAADGRAAYPDLAAFTGWSESTVKRRLEYLRESRALFFDVEIDSTILGYDAEVLLWLTVPPTELVNVAQGLSSHPEVVFAAATTGPTNLVAIVVCRDIHSFYDYLTTKISALTAVSQVQTAPVIRGIKRAGRLPTGSKHLNPSP